MKQILILLLCAVSTIALAQPNQVFIDPKATMRTLTGSFNKVDVSSGIELVLTQSNEQALAISVSDDKYEHMLKTVVENGELKIWVDNNDNSSKKDRNRKITVYLSCKMIESIKGSSGALVKLVNEIAGNQMSLSFSSGARFLGKLQLKILGVDLSSGAAIDVSGTALDLSVAASSGASFKGYSLISQNCTTTVSSGAMVSVYAEKNLSVSANSGAQVKYKGNAIMKKKSLGSGGSVKHE
jgi:hypothetical protein